MGLVLVLSLAAALGGGIGAWCLFEKGRELRRYANRQNQSALCMILAAVCGAFAVSAARLALEILNFGGLLPF